jgi:hypothetical protein
MDGGPTGIRIDDSAFGKNGGAIGDGGYDTRFGLKIVDVPLVPEIGPGPAALGKTA